MPQGDNGAAVAASLVQGAQGGEGRAQSLTAHPPARSKPDPCRPRPGLQERVRGGLWPVGGVRGLRRGGSASGNV